MSTPYDPSDDDLQEGKGIEVKPASEQPAVEALYTKYGVHRTDTGEHLEDGFFVLRFDRDPAAREALRAYISNCKNVELRKALMQALKETTDRFHAAQVRGHRVG